MSALMKGITIGITIAAPVGPIGILCIRRTLNLGRLHGFVSGAGAATADAVYGTIAALGLTAIGSFLAEQASWLDLVGSLFLFYLAVGIARAASADPKTNPESGLGYGKAYGTTLLLTLTNPMTIVAFAGILAGVNLGTGIGARVTFVAGVFAGSLLWWLALSLAVGASKRIMPDKARKAINWISAAVLAAFGAVHLADFARTLL